jgi:hypothetical protein
MVGRDLLRRRHTHGGCASALSRTPPYGCPLRVAYSIHRACRRRRSPAPAYSTCAPSSCPASPAPAARVALRPRHGRVPPFLPAARGRAPAPAFVPVPPARRVTVRCLSPPKPGRRGPMHSHLMRQHRQTGPLHPRRIRPGAGVVAERARQLRIYRFCRLRPICLRRSGFCHRPVDIRRGVASSQLDPSKLAPSRYRFGLPLRQHDLADRTQRIEPAPLGVPSHQLLAVSRRLVVAPCRSGRRAGGTSRLS